MYFHRNKLKWDIFKLRLTCNCADHMTISLSNLIFLFSPSNWHNLLWRYVWLVAPSPGYIQSTTFASLHILLHFSTCLQFHTGSPATLPCLAVCTPCLNLMKMSQSGSSKFLAFVLVSGKFTLSMPFSMVMVSSILLQQDLGSLWLTGCLWSSSSMESQWLLHLWRLFSKMLQDNGLVLVQYLSLQLMQQMNFLRQVFSMTIYSFYQLQHYWLTNAQSTAWGQYQVVIVILINLILDEAHVVKELGSSFCSGYLWIGPIHYLLNQNRPIGFHLATATMPPSHINEIMGNLHLCEDHTSIFRLSMDCPKNLFLLCRILLAHTLILLL